jgi:hypothetical protein
MIALISITSLAIAIAVLLALAYDSLVAEHRRLEDVHDALLRELEAEAEHDTP